MPHYDKKELYSMLAPYTNSFFKGKEVETRVEVETLEVSMYIHANSEILRTGICGPKLFLIVKKILLMSHIHRD